MQLAHAMLSEQDAYQKSLDKLDRVVAGFGKHTDLGKVREVSAELLTVYSHSSLPVISASRRTSEVLPLPASPKRWDAAT